MEESAMFYVFLTTWLLVSLCILIRSMYSFIEDDSEKRRVGDVLFAYASSSSHKSYYYLKVKILKILEKDQYLVLLQNGEKIVVHECCFANRSTGKKGKEKLEMDPLSVIPWDYKPDGSLVKSAPLFNHLNPFEPFSIENQLKLLPSSTSSKKKEEKNV